MFKKLNEIINKYKMFLKYLGVAIISFVIDIFFFTVFNTLLKLSIILATILARLISSFINFLLNKEKVFNSKEKMSITIIKYYLLVVVQMLVSAFSVKFIAKYILINPTFIKVPVECILFICNYLIQKILIFKRGNNYATSQK